MRPATAGIKFGVQLLKNAPKMPVYSIASATGFDRSIVVEKLLEQDNRDLVYDPATGDCIETFKSGNTDLRSQNVRLKARYPILAGNPKLRSGYGR
ncbi:hypothetical protein AB3S75_014415 [Citrus x aurantiifolia]